MAAMPGTLRQLNPQQSLPSQRQRKRTKHRLKNIRLRTAGAGQLIKRIEPLVIGNPAQGRKVISTLQPRPAVTSMMPTG